MPHITNFHKGTVLTRTEPRYYVKGEGSYTDDRYIGSPMTYHGLANGMIYLTTIENNEPKLVGLPIHTWCDGWEQYIDPASLVGETEKVIESTLQVQLFEALENEDYTKAIKLRDEISKFKRIEKQN
jgi:hypothetical protein